MGFIEFIKGTHQKTMFAIHHEQILKNYWSNKSAGMSHDDDIWVILGPYFDRAIQGDHFGESVYNTALAVEKGLISFPKDKDREKFLLTHITIFRGYLKQMEVYDDIEKASLYVLGMEYWRKQKGLKPTGLKLLIEEFGYNPSSNAPPYWTAEDAEACIASPEALPKKKTKPYWTPKDAAAFGYLVSGEENDEE